MMVHWLLRLHEDDPPANWGEHWPRHADPICELDLVGCWLGPPDWLAARSRRQLDWGAAVYEVTKDDLLRLISAGRPSASSHRRETQDQQARVIEGLSPERYAVVWIECY